MKLDLNIKESPMLFEHLTNQNNVEPHMRLWILLMKIALIPKLSNFEHFVSLFMHFCDPFN